MGLMVPLCSCSSAYCQRGDITLRLLFTWALILGQSLLAAFACGRHIFYQSWLQISRGCPAGYFPNGVGDCPIAIDNLEEQRCSRVSELPLVLSLLILLHARSPIRSSTCMIGEWGVCVRYLVRVRSEALAEFFGRSLRIRDCH